MPNQQKHFRKVDYSHEKNNSARIEKSVAKLPGIQEVSVNLLKNSMVASYDESVLDTEGIVQAVEKAGYGAFPKSVQNIADGWLYFALND